MDAEIELTPGEVLLAVMRDLEQFTDEELRATVRAKVTSVAERNSYERLSENAPHDTLLLLSARALAHQLIQLRRS